MSKIILPPSFQLPQGNLIRQGLNERMEGFKRKLIQSNGVAKGTGLFQEALMGCVNAVSDSFEDPEGAMRNPTKEEQNRRIDICFEIVLGFDAQRYPVVRIVPLIYPKLAERLGIADSKVHRAHSWRKSEKLDASQHEEIIEDEETLDSEQESRIITEF